MASFSHHHQQHQRAISPHRTMVWKEPNNKPTKVPVVYYLCREDGQLEHPHFMEVTTTSGSGSGRRLCLRDFTERLDMLRGKGMAAMYSWSSKRSYRNNGFVWHDLTEDDVIHPATANEYVLKGSHRRFSSQRSSSICRKYRGSSSVDDLAAADDDDHQQQQVVSDDDEISPPPSSSSPSGDSLHQETTLVATSSGGRMRASSLLMQLVSCGSVTNTTLMKCHSRRPEKVEEMKKTSQKSPSGGEAGRDDPRDYFSGSLVESNNRKKKHTTLSLKRSCSCNAADTDDRRLELEAIATGSSSSLIRRTPAGAEHTRA